MANTKRKVRKKAQKRKESVFDFAFSAMGNGWEFLKKKWKGIFVDYFKVILAIVGIAFLFGIIMGGVGALAPMLLPVVFPLILIMILIVGPLGAVVYNIVDKYSNNKKVKIIEQAKINFVPFLKWMILWIGIIVILAAPFAFLFGGTIISVFDDIQNGVSPITSLMFLLPILFMGIILLIIITTILNFIIQFTVFELFIARAGLRESLKRSYKIVKKNFFETIVFNISLGVIAGVLGFVVGLPMQIGIRAVPFMAASKGFGALGMIGLILMILMTIITFLLTVMIKIGALSIEYTYWKKARQR